MILYHVISNYQLLCAIVHRAARIDEESVLIVSQWTPGKVFHMQNLGLFFDKIIVMDAMIKTEPENFYAGSNNVYVKEMLEKNRIKLSQCREIHVAGAHFRFGAYLAENQIPHIYWEDAAGLLSRPSVLFHNEDAQPRKQEYCLKMGLYDGSNPAVIKRICNLNAQVEGFHDELAEHFDVTAELGRLDEAVRRKVLSIFTKAEQIDLPEDSVLFLTQHFANLQLMSFEEQALLYQLVVDYFFPEDRVVFKPHPDDLMYYGFLFPESTVIREKFPSEFLPFIFKNKPKTIATISSTGVFNLRGYFDHLFSFDFRLQEHFKDIHRYYAAVLLAKTLGVECSQVEQIGTDEKLVENLFCAVTTPATGKADRFLIVDNASLAGKNTDDILELAAGFSENGGILFLNSREDFCFYDMKRKGIWNDIVPLCLTKRRIREEEFFSDTGPETIYFFSKSERLIEMAEKFTFDQKLKYTGLKVSLESMTPEQKQIKVLEGVLAATEKRLLYYMELVEQGSGKK